MNSVRSLQCLRCYLGVMSPLEEDNVSVFRVEENEGGGRREVGKRVKKWIGRGVD